MVRTAFLTVVLLSASTGLAAAPSTQPATQPTPADRPRLALGGRGAAYPDFLRLVQKERPAQAAQFPRLQFGIVLLDVVPGESLDRAGLTRGDILIRCGDTGFKDAAGYRAWVDTLEIGKSYTLTVIRRPNEEGGKLVWKPAEKVTLTVLPKPDEPAVAPVSQPSPDSPAETHVGPRGGIYHYGKNGEKVYEKH